MQLELLRLHIISCKKGYNAMATYRIAGLTVQMDTFGRTASQAIPYLIEDPEKVDMIVEGAAELLHSEAPELSLDDCEHISTSKSFYLQLLLHNGFMLHASAVAMDGKAYLFSAASGTGKSTHTQLWQRVFGEDRARILNDDKPALRLEDGKWYAYGTPWSGKYDISLNLRLPLAGICVLERGDQNSIEPVPAAKAVYALLNQTIRPRGLQAKTLLMEHIGSLVESVPVYLLRCNMEPEAAILSHGVMSGQQSQE